MKNVLSARLTFLTASPHISHSLPSLLSQPPLPSLTASPPISHSLSSHLSQPPLPSLTASPPCSHSLSFLLFKIKVRNIAIKKILTIIHQSTCEVLQERHFKVSPLYPQLYERKLKT